MVYPSTDGHPVWIGHSLVTCTRSHGVASRSRLMDAARAAAADCGDDAGQRRWRRPGVLSPRATRENLGVALNPTSAKVILAAHRII